MPGGDRTGPDGMGPVTGRGLGYCTGNQAPGYAYPSPGRGFGRGRGMGRGRGWGRRGGWSAAPAWYAPAPPVAPAPEQELDGLRRAAEQTREALKRIEERIEELSQS